MFRQRVIYGDEMLYILDFHDNLIPLTYDQILTVVIHRFNTFGEDRFNLGILVRRGKYLWSDYMSEPECRELCVHLENRHGFRGFESVGPLFTRYSFRTEGFRVRDGHVEYQGDSGTWVLAAWMLPDDIARFWTVMRFPPWISRPLLALASHWDILNWVSCHWSRALSWLPFRRKNEK